MGLSEKLVEIKSEADALIQYANGVTGESDTSLGDAILSLADGYGQGGGGAVFSEFDFSIDSDADTVVFDSIDYDESAGAIAFIKNVTEFSNEDVEHTYKQYSVKTINIPVNGQNGFNYGVCQTYKVSSGTDYWQVISPIRALNGKLKIYSSRKFRANTVYHVWYAFLPNGI